MKILIAEDNIVSRRILESRLIKWGYEVLSADDGNRAWEKLQDPDPPKLAILDWIMPKMDGIELCRKIRQKESSTPIYIILLTALSSKKDVVRGLEAGADDYIAKPFDKNELRARIEVGRRIVDLQTALADKEKLQGVIEMAGAVCHELNQPMQVVSGISELLKVDLTDSPSFYKNIQTLQGQIDRMSTITRKLMRITKYETKGYLKGKIIDIEKAAK
ncbi:MAG: response regulator [Desulfobacterales bacterium]|nr:response regulator [Desulfobacterales bacterium]